MARLLMGLTEKRGDETDATCAKVNTIRCPSARRWGVSDRDSAPVAPPSRGSNRPPHSFISMESPLNAWEAGSPSQEDFEDNCEQSFFTTLDLVGWFVAMDADSVAAAETGATAN